ncbi:MAG: DUF192 domain-containing protein [Betaproteobacteria bacterium AqS2]|uniref:DUF192 domain-containing protein n=1 Tax=Candidatus Amphirhobacter heronislandensis TaxID=1732024 RepID=A0A930Y189_9GAMM|nr:DUF192 domain-containing protein [Betaproteobacteria bacterium AqS2]
MSKLLAGLPLGIAILSLIPLASCAQRVPTIELELAGTEITLEIARSDEEMAKGLSKREELAPDSGMVFVFPAPRATCFWMKDTFVPLDALFITRLGLIDRIATMEPLSLQSHCANAPVLWVIELPAGWAAAHGLKEGDPVGRAALARLQGLRRR